jgi:hypothetical protein
MLSVSVKKIFEKTKLPSLEVVTEPEHNLTGWLDLCVQVTVAPAIGDPLMVSVTRPCTSPQPRSPGAGV